MSENCNHDCSSCSSNCSSRKKESFLKAPHKNSSVKKIIGVVKRKAEKVFVAMITPTEEEMEDQN